MATQFRRSLLVVASATAVALAGSTVGFAGPSAPAATNPNTDAPATSGVDASSAIVVLAGTPLSTAPGTRNAKGRVDRNRNESRSAQASLSAQRNDFKRWLRSAAPKARVTGEHDLALNAVMVDLNGTPLSALSGGPSVSTVQHDVLYRPSAAPPAAGAFDPAHPDLSLIHAMEAWGGSDTASALAAGRGVKVAIVDTGIDLTNPCFNDSGFPGTTQAGDTRFTNNKVIVARVFSNKAQSRHLTPEALQEHGTHVAGTVGCRYGQPAAVNGVQTSYPLWGVAPGSQLGSYNVFPGDDATGITNARSEDILNALEAAYDDGMDVANMSLGGDTHGVQDLLAIGVDNLSAAGMTIAISAGNEGPGSATIGSPGSAQRAITAGASTVPHFIANPVVVDGSTYPGASGDFGTVTSLTAPLGVVTSSPGVLSTACTSLPAGSLTGKVGLIARGACSFSAKIRTAQDAGALAVLVVNNAAGPPVSMGQDGTANQPTVPALMLAQSAGPALVGKDGAAVSISGPAYLQQPEERNIMAGFSSVGPVDVSARIKPDAVAPGVNVLSSIPHQFCDASPCFAFFQGTSMASPHLAGSAAVLLGQHRSWTPQDVQSALTNTAERHVLRDSTAQAMVTSRADSVQVQGGGLENLQAATRSTLTLDPVSTSFGTVPAGAGRTKTIAVTLTNRAATSVTLTPTLSDVVTANGVAFSVPASLVTIGAGRSVSLPVTVTTAKQAATGPSSAYLVLTNGAGAEVAHAALFVATR